MSQPVVEPDGEPLECGEIFTRIADAMGLIPTIPDALYQTAQTDRFAFAVELMALARFNPGVMKAIPFILSKTLVQQLGFGNLTALWGLGLLFTAPEKLRKDAQRAGWAMAGWGESILAAPARLPTIFKSMARNRSAVPLAGLHPKAGYGERLFQAVMDHSKGCGWDNRTLQKPWPPFGRPAAGSISSSLKWRPGSRTSHPSERPRHWPPIPTFRWFSWPADTSVPMPTP